MFLPPTSILDPIIYPFADKFYPLAILIKHHVWFLPTADLFISLDGILYGVHQSYFNQSPLFQEIIRYGEADGVGTNSYHPIPFNTLKRKFSTTPSTYYTLTSNNWNISSAKIGSISNALAWTGIFLTLLHSSYNNLLPFKEDYYHQIFESWPTSCWYIE
jgi:hypothetical protein